MRGHDSQRIALWFIAGVLLLLSSAGAFLESQPFLSRGNDPKKIVEALTAGSRDVASVSILESRYARRAFLGSCLESLQAAETDLRVSVTLRRRLTVKCLEISNGIIARSPLSANGWFLAATLLDRLGDGERGRGYLRRSFETGPFEGWVAERRALFSYRIKDTLDDDLLDKMRGDFILLLESQNGRAALASLYVNDPTVRVFLTNLAETRADAVQQEFFWTVQKTVRDMNSDSP